MNIFRRFGLLCLVALLLPAVCACSPKENNKESEEAQGTMEGESWRVQAPENGKNILISVFWPPSKGYTTDEQYENLVEGGIDLLEWNSDPIFTDPTTLSETLRLCEKYGIRITVCDRDMTNIQAKTDEELREIVERYKSYSCVAGYYLIDEPVNANPYGPVVRTLTAAHPGAICQMNMLPMGALADPRGHAEDWISAAGKGNLAYLSFDQYPFGQEKGSVPQMFGNMELVREIGLKYHVDTALYIQAIGVIGGFRRPTVDETRFHTSAALAYGYKNLKYFTWITPVKRSEEFTDAIILPSGERSDTFDGVCAINADIKKVAAVLGNLDAVEIYHVGRRDAGTNNITKDFFVKPDQPDDCLLSLMRDRTNGRNFLMVVNKDFQNETTLSFRLDGVSYVVDCTDGLDGQQQTVLRDGNLQVSLKAGGFRLYALPAGENYVSEPTSNSENLALNCAVYTSSSVGTDGYYGYKAVDGKVFNSEAWRGQKTDEGDTWIEIDLGSAREVARVDIYPSMSRGKIGKFFPRGITVQVSENGTDYTNVAQYQNSSLPDTVPVLTFERVQARYVRLVISNMVSMCDIGEIQVFADANAPMPPEFPAGETES